MNLHKYQYPETGKVRLANYEYNGWVVSHYVLPPEQFMAIDGFGGILRASTKDEIEQLIDEQKDTKR